MPISDRQTIVITYDDPTHRTRGYKSFLPPPDKAQEIFKAVLSLRDDLSRVEFLEQDLQLPLHDFFLDNKTGIYTAGLHMAGKGLVVAEAFKEGFALFKHQREIGTPGITLKYEVPDNSGHVVLHTMAKCTLPAPAAPKLVWAAYF